MKRQQLRKFRHSPENIRNETRPLDRRALDPSWQCRTVLTNVGELKRLRKTAHDLTANPTGSYSYVIGVPDKQHYPLTKS